MGGSTSTQDGSVVLGVIGSTISGLRRIPVQDLLAEFVHLGTPLCVCGAQVRAPSERREEPAFALHRLLVDKAPWLAGGFRQCDGCGPPRAGSWRTIT